MAKKAKFASLIRQEHLPYLVYGAAAIITLGPLLMPGYVFALDMVFGPRLAFPSEVTNLYPFEIVLWLINHILPSQIIQKLILVFIIVASGLGAHRLAAAILSRVPRLSAGATTGAYFAGLFYIINPFTYARFMDGQYLVLLGYALLPFFARALFDLAFEAKAGRRQIFRLTGWSLLLTCLSVHSVGYQALLFAGVVVAAIVTYRADWPRLKHVLVALAVSAALMLLGSLYWLIPAVSGQSGSAALIAQFDQRHMLTFRTTGEGAAGVLGNIFSLQGYWGEREGHFITLRDTVFTWKLGALLVIALAVYGAYLSWRRAHVRAMVISSGLAAVLAAGITAKPFSIVNRWLYDNVFYFSGFREPQKFVALLALAYAILGGIAAANLLTTAQKLSRSTGRRALLASGVLSLPLLLMPFFPGGFTGQLEARQYPSDWSSVDEKYLSRSRGATLFLPWHLYMYYDFAGRLIANPAEHFFSGTIIAGDDPELGLIERVGENPESTLIETLLAEGELITNFGQRLLPLKVEHVLLSKNADWESYAWLDRQPDLKLLEETESMKVYKNIAYGGQP